MLTFVLSAGTGGATDFFGQVGNMFGRAQRGTVVAEAYGDNISTTELDELRRERLAANSFMSMAEEASFMNLAKDLKKDLQGNRLTKDTKDAIDRFIGLKVDSIRSGEDFNAYMTYTQQMFGGPPAQLIQKARASAKPDSDDVKALDNVQDILFHDLINARMPSPFFRTVMGDTTKDLLDYDLLLKKADKLGIAYSPAAIKELVTKDTGGRLTSADNGKIEQTLRKSGRFPNFSGDWLMKAVTNEYRARAVMVTLQGNMSSGGGRFAKGESATLSSGPGAVTPYEFYKFYQDRCRELNYTLFEIPTASLVSQVKEEPTAKDRNLLFMKYRNEEADPNRDTPGFKESRKVKIEFVTVDAKAKRVADAVKPVTAASVFLSGIAGPMSVGGNGIAALTQAAQPHLAETLPVKRDLDDRRALANNRIAPGEQFFFRPRDTSIFRPEPIASLLGSLSGHPDFAKFHAAQTLAVRNIEIEHLKTMAPVVLQSWLAPFNLSAANAFGWPALAYAHNPKPIHDALYLKDIVAQLKKDQIHSLFKKDTDEFQNKMLEAARDMFGPAPDKAKSEAAQKAANKFAADWAAARGLTIGGNKEAVTKTTILTDPALKPLVEAAEKDLAKDPAEPASSLVKKFFDMFPQQDPRMPPMMQTMKFDPEFFPNARASGEDLDKPTLMVWLTDELPPVAYNSFDIANKETKGEMTKLVDAAWKLDKAKALAQKEADKVAEQVKTIAKAIESNKPGVEKQFTELPYKQFPVEGLAKLKFQHGATQASMNYETPKLTKEQVANPTPDFVEKLIDQRNKPLGTTIVLHDAPRSKYYVAVLMSKNERTVDQFRDVFNKSNATGASQNPLYSQYALSDERQKEVRDAILRLRAEAKLTENEEFIKNQKREAETE
ncbi:hypothetical protein [Zavarzinella formosa]|uniref:hypothetical protein n=1 Tax=Zavarzinella formosa TaxID=360055 RepID=UPI0012F74325|nr:hypothetical protein [Zavarzinella formosa]